MLATKHPCDTQEFYHVHTANKEEELTERELNKLIQEIFNEAVDRLVKEYDR